MPLTGGSDGHYLHEIGVARTVLSVEEPTFEELVRAFAGEEERSVDRAPTGDGRSPGHA